MSDHDLAPDVAALEDLDRRPAPSVIRDLGNAGRSADTLPVPVRQRLVAHLEDEGFTVGDTAHLLSISERTVARDRAAVRAEGKLTPSLALGDELLGQLERATGHAVRRLTRLANDRDAPPYARLWAEDAIGRAWQRLIDTAHKLGYFPSGHGRVTHLQRTTDSELERERQSMDGLVRLYCGDEVAKKLSTAKKKPR